MGKRPPGREGRYLITGGGTAGHVYPGLALAEGIEGKEPGARFLFVGARKGAEERIVPASGYNLRTLAVRGIPARPGPFAWFQTLWRLGISLLQAARIILRFRPDGIIGTGGYASAPVLLAAVVLRSLGLWKGVLSLHEANIVPGRFNRWISGRVDFTGISFPETLRFFPQRNTFWTGYPLRKDLETSSERRRGEREEPKRRLGIPSTGRVLLVFGGSSGARSINRALFGALPRLLQDKNLYIFHATGRPQPTYDPAAEFREILPGLPAETLEERYRQEEYLHHIERYYEAADLVVSRSGAGTIWELAAYGLPAVLVPKSNLPGDHQVKNAYFLARRGQARLLFETMPVPPEAPGAEWVDPHALADAVFEALDRRSEAEGPLNGGSGMGDLPTGKDPFHALIRRFRERGKGRPTTAPSPGAREPERPAEGGEGTGIEWLGVETLQAYVEGKWKHKQELSDQEKSYLKYKTAQLLTSPRWQDRNAGVKLIGLTACRERLPTLLHFVTDRTPVPWHGRLLGGDFRQVGFIRRNALQAIWRTHAYGADVRQALLTALSDPYYEVRSWAARAIDRLSPSIGEDEELVRLLRKNLKDPWFEVVVSSLRALARITRDPEILSDLVPLLTHKNWKVQQATVRCLMRLVQADVVRLPREAEQWVQRIPMKGLDFFPSFPLKQTWDDFQRMLSEKMEYDKTSKTKEGTC